MTASSIILMGPSRAGKSTVGKLLAKARRLPLHGLRAVERMYFTEVGFDEDKMERAWVQGGFETWFHYVKQFHPHALRRMLSDHPGEIVELDALLLVQENDVASSQMQSTLAPHTTVLLLPSPDDDTSIETLRERQRIRYNGIDLNEYCVRHPSNHLLAKLVVYTKGKTPEETCDEVMARVDPARGPIILIGPMQTGKSTVAQRLSERLGLPRESLDDHRWRYYEEIGFTRAEMQRIDDAEGPQGVIDYWKRFDAHAVDRLLTEFTRGVFDFGAGHSVYDDPDALERVRVRLEPFPNVVLLLPSPDADESVRILEQRSTPTIGGVELNRYLVTSPASRALAKLVVYTEGKTPEDTRDEILGHIAVPA